MTNTVAQLYQDLYEAFDFFNQELFEGRLPQVLITLSRKKSARGFFHPFHIQSRVEDGEVIHELALIPETFDGRTDEEIGSTFVHEMVHLDQEENGKPGKGSYHNKEWARMMHDIGLSPDNGNGGETGRRVSHTIDPEGLYQLAWRKLEATGFTIDWQAAPHAPTLPSHTTKRKYVCPGCDAKVWGKPYISIICGECEEPFEDES